MGVKVTDEEYDTIQAASDALGLSVSDALREALNLLFDSMEDADGELPGPPPLVGEPNRA